MTPLTSYKNLSTPDNAKNLGLWQSTLIEQRHRGIQYFMVKLFVEGSPSVRKKFYARSALLHGRWLFLAYLQGIETIFDAPEDVFSELFLAYLQGIETGLAKMRERSLSKFLAYLQGIETTLRVIQRH